MRKIIVSNLASLDGFFEGPNRELDWFTVDAEFLEYARELLNSVDAILFGRLTYEHMAKHWPTAPPDEISNKMNDLPKIVFSKTLDKVEWKNSRLVKDKIAEEVAELKHQPGKDMVIFGSAELASYLVRQGLIDEYRIILNPVLVGAGNPLFKGMNERIRMKLMGTKQFGSGVVVLYYQPA